MGPQRAAGPEVERAADEKLRGSAGLTWLNDDAATMRKIVHHSSTSEQAHVPVRGGTLPWRATSDALISTPGSSSVWL
jgi:hypothetical protein